MKTSRRLMLGTFIALLTVPVAFTAYSRITGTSITGPVAPQRTPAAELASLSDYSAIEIAGDIALEIVAASDYAIDYSPVSAERGNLMANVEGGTLYIEAFGNSDPGSVATLRIAMPSLQRLDAEFLMALTIRDFSGDTMTLKADVVADGILLENNRLGTLDLEFNSAESVALRGNTIGTSRVTRFGLTVVTE